MAKKMFDILPPKEARKIEKKVNNFVAEKKPRVKKLAKAPVAPKIEKKFPVYELLAGGGVIAALLAIYFIAKLPKADIQIWPAMSPVTLQESVTADKSASSVNLETKTIPAIYIEEEKSGSQEFPATGNASNDGKAEGTITLYNKYEPSAPLSLKLGTHFLSDSGKYFVSLSKVTIPAATYKGGKLVPGSVEVKVQAQESGESYNIKSAKFSVPKLAGTPYYYSIYGESEKPMAGGYAGQIKKITEDDIATAKDSLVQKIGQEAETALRSKLSEGQILIDGSVGQDVLQSESSQKAGTVADNFNYQAKVKISALAIEKRHLEEFAKSKIYAAISDDDIFLDKSLNLKYDVKSLDIKEGKMDLGLQINGSTYKGIDQGDLKAFASGKPADKIKQSISENFPEQITKSEVKFWPFWVKKAPNSEKRINVDLKFE